MACNAAAMAQAMRVTAVLPESPLAQGLLAGCVLVDPADVTFWWLQPSSPACSRRASSLGRPWSASRSRRLMAAAAEAPVSLTPVLIVVAVFYYSSSFQFDFGAVETLDLFYSADVVFTDLTDPTIQQPLFYQVSSLAAAAGC